jgi:hypothetical protein
MAHLRRTPHDRLICAETRRRDRTAHGRIPEIAHLDATLPNRGSSHIRTTTLLNAPAVMDQHTPAQERGSNIRRNLALRVITLHMEEAT